MMRFMKANGRIIKCMEEGFTSGLMGVNMRGSICLIRRMDMECTLGLMVGSIKDIGPTGNSKVLEDIFCLMEVINGDYGKMQKG